MTELRPVAALCVSSVSEYHSIPGVTAYNFARDVRTFKADRPGVFHPPCRSWSVNYANVAKPLPGEREVGLLCCSLLKRVGGVLENPARSGLFRAGGLPWPGEGDADLFTVEVLQSWWGYGFRKRTWLCFSGVDEASLVFPFRMAQRSHEGLSFERQRQRQRSYTVRALAEWLVDAARRTRIESVLVGDGGRDLQRKQPVGTRRCEQCREWFVASRGHVQTCSDKCRKRRSRGVPPIAINCDRGLGPGVDPDGLKCDGPARLAIAAEAGPELLENQSAFGLGLQKSLFSS